MDLKEAQLRQRLQKRETSDEEALKQIEESEAAEIEIM